MLMRRGYANALGTAAFLAGCSVFSDLGGFTDDPASGLAAACEKIPKALPQMVVASASLGADALAALEDRAVAVGSVFLLLGELPDYESMGRQLETGIALARERFGRHRRSPPS
jgi:hypothetical protein